MPVTVESGISGPFYPNGVTTAFAFNFKADSTAEVLVVDEDGISLSSALYSVTLNSGEGGTVTFSVAPLLADYAALFIVSSPAMTQESDFGNAGPSFNPASVTRAFDRAAIRDLFLQAQLDRTIKFPFGDAVATLPASSSRASQYLAFDIDGNPVMSSGTGADSGLRSDVAAVRGQLLIGSPSSISALKGIAKSGIPDGAKISVTGFSEDGDGGGGDFLWNASSTATPIQGFIVQLDEGGAGRFIRQHNGAVTDIMAGAKVDGVTFDDAALAALNAAVIADLSIFRIDLPPGVSKVLPTGETAKAAFYIADRPGLTFEAAGREYATARTYAESVASGNSSVFTFSNCQNTRFLGRPKFTGPLTVDQIKGGASANGSLGIVMLGDCTGSEIVAEGFGVLEALLANRLPKLCMDAAMPIFIANGGAGYAVNDILSLPALQEAGAGTTEVVGTVKVLTVDGGGKILTAAVENPGRYPAFYNGALAVNVAGHAPTGGTGTGALISPYMKDWSNENGAPISRRCKVDIVARQCYYGFNGQWNFEDSDIVVDGDVCYRVYFHYGVKNIRGRIKIVNQHGASIFACIGGVETSGAIELEVLPATLAGFWGFGSALVQVCGSGVAGRNTLDLTINGNKMGQTVQSGQYFTLEKYANGVQDNRPRGHIYKTSVLLDLKGHSLQDSGMAANVFGSNVNYGAGNWKGDQWILHFKDGCRTTGIPSSWGMCAHADLLKSLHVGAVDFTNTLQLDPLAEGIALTPSGPVTVAASAKFANRFETVGTHIGLDYIVVTSDVTLSANMSGATITNGSGGATRVVSLPDASQGQAWGFANNRAAASRLEIVPQGADRIGAGRDIGGGVFYGGYGKRLRLLNPSVRCRLAASATDPNEDWQIDFITGAYGTDWDFQP